MQDAEGDPEDQTPSDSPTRGASARNAVAFAEETLDEDEDTFCGDPHSVKRCPEAQVLQTICSGLDPSRGLPSGVCHKVARRESCAGRSFFQLASLPSIQEKPFHDKAFFVESDFPSADTASACASEESERPVGHPRGTLHSPLRYDHHPLAPFFPSRSHKPQTQAVRPDVYASSSEQETVAVRRVAPNPGSFTGLPTQVQETSTALCPLRIVEVVPESVPEQPVVKGIEHLDAEEEVISTPQLTRERLELPRYSLLEIAAIKIGQLNALALHQTADSIRRIFLATRPRVSPLLRALEGPRSNQPPRGSDSRIVPLHGSESTDSDYVGIPTIIAQGTPAPAATTSSSNYLQVPAVLARRLGRDVSDDSWDSVSSAASSAPYFDDDLEWNLRASSRTRSASADTDRFRAEILSSWGQTQFERLPSIGSCCCRICQNSASSERLISPCLCKGSLAYVHLSCLERWLNQSGRTYCELCQYQFNATATPRYGIIRSMQIWYRHPRNRRQLMADLLISSILSMVTLGLMTVTVAGMRYFVEEGRKLGVTAVTTQGTIVFFLALVGVGYAITMYLLIKDQITPWQQWWRNNVDVRLRLDLPATRA